MKDFKDWDWNELVDHCAGEVVKDLLLGKLRSAVAYAMQTALRWNDEQKKKKKTK